MPDWIAKKHRIGTACTIFLLFAALWIGLRLVQSNGKAVFYTGEAHGYRVFFECYTNYSDYDENHHPGFYDDFDSFTGVYYLVGRLYTPELKRETLCNWRLIATTGHPLQGVFLGFRELPPPLKSQSIDNRSFWTEQRKFVSLELSLPSGEVIYIPLKRTARGALSL